MKSDLPKWANNLNEQELKTFIPTRTVKYATKSIVRRQGVGPTLKSTTREVGKVYTYVRPQVSLRVKKPMYRVSTGRIIADTRPAIKYTTSGKEIKPRKTKQGRETFTQAKKDASLSERVKREFLLFLCKNTAEYRGLKNKLIAASSSGTTLIVARLSESISISIGVPAAGIMAIIAALLLILLHVGKKVMCTYLIE